MNDIATVVIAWLLFGGSHVGLALHPVRSALVRRLGLLGFTALFFLVASVTYANLIHSYALVIAEGPPGLALGSFPWIRNALVVLSSIGLLSAGISLFDYRDSGYALATAGRVAEPRGFARVTRHGVFAGLGLIGIAHALLATHATGTVFFAGLALFSFAGAAHQDAKLIARCGESHRRYVAQTSTLPFLALATGRTRLMLSELRPLSVALGVAVAWAVARVHDSLFAAGGAYVIGATIGGALFLGLLEVRRTGVAPAGRRSPSTHP